MTDKVRELETVLREAAEALAKGNPVAAIKLLAPYRKGK